jgi:polysaccharide chain length determinant protein (PEP-CTERM system associated)
MDKVYIRDLILALKAELIRFRFWFVALFITISFLVLAAGVFWPKNYTTSALLVADITTIIEPLLKGRAEVTGIDRSEQAREVIYTRSILEAAGKEAGLITKNTSAKEQDRIIRDLRDGLSVKPEKNNYFRISYVSPDPDRSFETLNAIINVFIEDTARKKREESLGAYTFIDAQVQTYKRQLELAEEKLKEFKGQNLDGNEGTVTARIAQLRNEIEALKITIEETQARINIIQQQLNNEGQYQQAKGQVDDLRQRRQILSTQLEQLLLSYQESYPDVISLRAQIQELDVLIESLRATGDVYGSSTQIENPLYEELRKQLQAADVDIRGQKRRMQSLIHLQEQEYERAKRVATNQAELSELTRDYNVTRDVYEEMLQRKESARLSMTLDIEGQGVSYRIQEPASFPLQPTGIRFIHLALAGPLLGILFPLGLLVLYVMLDPHLRSARALQNQLPPEIEIVGVIPHYHSPLGERLLRKDVVVLLLLGALAMAAYVSFVVYWQNLRG